jgi:hypothetical protein
MEYSNHISFENVVEADPTLKFLIRDSQLNFDLLEHQVNLRASALMIAISKWIDLNYR